MQVTPDVAAAIVSSIPTAAWVLVAVVGVPTGLFFWFWKFGRDRTESLVNKSYDNVAADNDRLREEIVGLKSEIGDLKSLCVDIMRHFTKCHCVEQKANRDLLDARVQKMVFHAPQA